MTNSNIKNNDYLKFYVNNLINIKEIDPYEPYCVISYTQPGDPDANVPRNSNCFGIHRVRIDDVDDVNFAEKMNYKILDKTQAENILNFVKECLDKGVIRIYCHCLAGISRSSGTIAGLLKLLKNDDSMIFDNKQFRPNMHIYNMLINSQIETDILGDYSSYGKQ